MTFDEMTKAIEDAAIIMRRADRHVDEMARLVAGKLRSSRVSGYTLELLKRELRDYNIHTSSWKND